MGGAGATIRAAMIRSRRSSLIPAIEIVTAIDCSGMPSIASANRRSATIVSACFE
jgi:hypothetical protein